MQCTDPASPSLGALPNAGFPFWEDAPKVNEDITTHFLFQI